MSELYNESLINVAWILFCSSLVFLMQGGFTALESGLTRQKNTINVAVKNLTDTVISIFLFWFMGYSFMYGESILGLIGSDMTLADINTMTPIEGANLVYQSMFCATAITLTSGAVAERMRFRGFMVIALILSVFVYPVFGHWAWNPNGWLAQLGFADFAGATVVHSLGGWTALCAIIIIGPRLGRFDESGGVKEITSSNLSLSMIGCLLLWLGWLGFNGGSSTEFGRGSLNAIFNTLIAGASGGCAILLLAYIRNQRLEPKLLINGCLSGLVAITACAIWCSSAEAALVGSAAAYVMLAVSRLLLWFRLDDAIDVVPVHLGAGSFGTLCCAFFIDDGRSFIEILGVQFLGVLVCGLWVISVVYFFLRAVNYFNPLRIDEEGELLGLNISEHGASTELHQFIKDSEYQTQSQDLGHRASVDPHTELGIITHKYNQVMDELESNIAKTNAIVRLASEAIITFSPDDHLILTANPAALKIFGLTREELKKTSFYTLLAGNKTAEDIDIESFKGPGPIDLKAINYEQAPFDMQLSLSEIKSDAHHFYTAIIRDVTVQKNMEADLVASRDAAKNALKKLETTRQDLIDAERLASLGAMVAGMAHEINTPLGVIVTATSNLEDKTNTIYKKFSEDEVTVDDFESFLALSKESLRLILNNAQRTGAFIASFKEVAVDQTCEAPRQFKLQEYLNKVVDSLRPKLRKTKIEIVVNCPKEISLVSYPGAYAQIITNLIMNSIVHGYEDNQQGEIYISARTLGDDQLELCYSDNGLGISQEISHKVFDPFFTTKRGRGGSGLGLSIVYNLITQTLKGDVELLRSNRQGAHFRILTPLSQMEMAEV